MAAPPGRLGRGLIGIGVDCNLVGADSGHLNPRGARWAETTARVPETPAEVRGRPGEEPRRPSDGVGAHPAVLRAPWIVPSCSGSACGLASRSPITGKRR